MPQAFEHGTSYPINTLPDDLHDKTIPNRDRWAIRDALFWNDCQGWWIGHISTERQRLDFGQSTARFWRPLPPAPMTRDQIVSERGLVVCAGCDIAIDPNMPHHCRPSENLVEQRRLQREVDRQFAPSTYVAPETDAA